MTTMNPTDDGPGDATSTGDDAGDDADDDDSSTGMPGTTGDDDDGDDSTSTDALRIDVTAGYLGSTYPFICE